MKQSTTPSHTPLHSDLERETLRRTRCYRQTLKAILQTTKTASDQKGIIIPAVPAPPLRPAEAQGRRTRPFSSNARVQRPVQRWCAPAAGSPVPGASLPPPVVLRSLRRSFTVLKPGSKSFPPRRDARNANNQSSAPAWAGLGGRRGAPEPSRVHPRAGPGGDTKKPGTPTPTAGARRDPRGAPPAAKFTAPRAPRARRCPRPGEVSRLGAPHPETPVGPRAPRRARETPLGSCPPLPRPPALAGRFRARGPPAAALTDVCPAGRRGPELDPPCSAPPWPHCLDGAPRSLSRSLFRAAEGLRRSRARSAPDWRLQTTPRASRPAQSRARRRPEQRTGGGAAFPRPPQLSLLLPDPCRWPEQRTNSECRFTSLCLYAYPQLETKGRPTLIEHFQAGFTSSLWVDA